MLLAVLEDRGLALLMVLPCLLSLVTIQPVERDEATDISFPKTWLPFDGRAQPEEV